jgi:hypothetical protein
LPRSSALSVPPAGPGQLFLPEPGLERHRKPRLLPGGPALDVLVGADLVDQPCIVGGEVSCREKPTRGCSSARGNAVVKKAVVKETLVERTVGKQGLGKRVLRKRCRIRCAEVIVMRKPVVRERILG